MFVVSLLDPQFERSRVFVRGSFARDGGIATVISQAPSLIVRKYSLASILSGALRIGEPPAFSQAPAVVSSLQVTYEPGACRFSLEQVFDVMISRSSMELHQIGKR